MKTRTMPKLKVSLKTRFTLVLGAYAITTLIIACLILFASESARKSSVKQHELLGEYQNAIAISEAVYDMNFRGAVLINSLSDEALDSFNTARKKVETLAFALNDKALSLSIIDSGRNIAAASLKALDYYIKDDRKAGDKITKNIQRMSLALQSRVLAHQEKRIAELMAMESKAARLNRMVGIYTIGLVALALFMAGVLYVLLYRFSLKPIQSIISALTRAAQDIGKAGHYRAELDNQGYEINAAKEAFNTLLDSTQNALQHAQTQATNAQRSEARWKAIFNLSPDSIILTDTQSGNIIDTNPAATKMLALDPGRISSYSAFEFHTHEREALETFFAQIQENGSARADNLSCKIGDEIKPVSVVGVEVPNETGGALMLYVRDLSDIIAQNTKLERAQKAAEQASEAKSAFLATISHEIRTPLNGIMGMAQALSLSPLNEDDADKVHTIVESGNILLTLLNDVLDISKINAGQMSLDKTPGNLAKVVTQTHKLFSPQAAEKGLAFPLAIDPDLPDTLTFDPLRVRQCLTNLISNALKFTKQGSVSIEARLLAKNNGKARIALRVSDTGIGMDENTRKAVFGSFVQADNSISREYGGTGLGLAITSELAHMMDGTISVESRPNEGSVFTFTFEADYPQTLAAPTEKEKPQEKPKAKARKINLGEKRLLLVDDSATNRKVIRMLLSVTHIDIAEAENGKEAIAQLEKQKFDLVLLDMHMPVMNGPDTILHIRSCAQDWSSIPVLAVTADAAIGQNGQYRAMGLDGYVAKPIDQRVLFSNLFKALDQKIHQPDETRKSA